MNVSKYNLSIDLVAAAMIVFTITFVSAGIIIVNDITSDSWIIVFSVGLAASVALLIISIINYEIFVINK